MNEQASELQLLPNMKQSLTFVGLLSALFTLSTGCSSMPSVIEKPEVSLESVDIQKASLTDATVLLKLSVHNPNPFKLKIDSMKYGLDLNGKSFASGNKLDGASVAANGDSEITIPVRMSYWELFTGFSDFVKTGKSAYNIKGTVTAGQKDFNFTNSGDVSLPSSEG